MDICGEFFKDDFILMKKNSEYRVFMKIDSNCLCIEHKEIKIPCWETELCNIGGCDTHQANDQHSRHVEIYVYLKKRNGKMFYRKLKIIKLKGSSDIVNKLEHKLRWICSSSDITFEEKMKKEDLPPKKKALVIINPFSGSRKGMNIFYDSLIPTLKIGWYSYTTVFTKSSEHVKTIGETFQCIEFDVIIFVSGDGTIHHFINGMATREDWEPAFNIPLCHISAGKGNAVASSIHIEVGENNAITSNLYTLLKGKPRKISLSAVTLDDYKTRRVIYSILTMNWGIIASADIESDKYSYLGTLGISLGALKAILRAQKYDIVIKKLNKNETEAHTFDPKVFLEDSVKLLLHEHEAGDKYDITEESFGIITSQFRMLTEYYEFSQKIKPGGNKILIFNLHGMNTRMNFFKLLSLGKSFEDWPSIISIDEETTGVYLRSKGGEVVIDGEHVHTGPFEMKQIIIPATVRILCRDE